MMRFVDFWFILRSSCNIDYRTMKIITNPSTESEITCTTGKETKQVVYQVEIEDSESESYLDISTRRPFTVPKKNVKRRKPVTGRRMLRPIVNQNYSEILGSVNATVPTKVISRYSNINTATIINSKPLTKQINGEEVEEIAIETGQTVDTNIPKWQRLIGNYQMTDIGDIIDELAELVYQYPNRGDYVEALNKAREFQFAQSLKTRQLVKVQKDLDQGQFKKRANIDYDRKAIDEHYRVVSEGHERGQKEKTMKRVERPKQENYGTKKYLPHLHTMPSFTEKSPDDWL